MNGTGVASVVVLSIAPAPTAGGFSPAFRLPASLVAGGGSGGDGGSGQQVRSCLVKLKPLTLPCRVLECVRGSSPRQGARTVSPTSHIRPPAASFQRCGSPRPSSSSSLSLPAGHSSHHPGRRRRRPRGSVLGGTVRRGELFRKQSCFGQHLRHPSCLFPNQLPEFITHACPAARVRRLELYSPRLRTVPRHDVACGKAIVASFLVV